VESLAQLEQLKNLGCDYAQGFYFARPQPAATFEKLLLSSVTAPPELRLVRALETLAG
jgi:EAL domain-containing protein (putative c-di-GMP-specific phosphodiesterase class I)